jgi:hypothetical protein
LRAIFVYDSAMGGGRECFSAEGKLLPEKGMNDEKEIKACGDESTREKGNDERKHAITCTHTQSAPGGCFPTPRKSRELAEAALGQFFGAKLFASSSESFFPSPQSYRGAHTPLLCHAPVHTPHHGTRPYSVVVVKNPFTACQTKICYHGDERRQ